MKKIALVGFVLLTFIIYSLHQRGDGSSHAAIKPNTTSVSNQSGSNGQPAGSSSTAPYKDGTYSGTAADAYYGYVQVQATVKAGRLVDVVFLQHPNDRQASQEINSQAMPLLKEQALKVQSAGVDGVSGATDTSQAFMQSLAAALESAKA
jgi:uncharacterized protein with FMN-binding domain